MISIPLSIPALMQIVALLLWLKPLSCPESYPKFSLLRSCCLQGTMVLFPHGPIQHAVVVKWAQHETHSLLILNPGCNMQYYANYYVHAHHKYQTYYPNTKLLVIETAMHWYIKTALCECFALLMVTAWWVITCIYEVAYKSMFCRVSATNLAHAYDANTPNHKNHIPISWCYSLDMNTGMVWDAFFLHSLIMDSLDCEETLELLHNGENQSTRIDIGSSVTT